ncbi:MAG: anthranilate synthase component I family protein [Bacteroidales bacterium]|jgi:para-aminobenzoate synthetase component 1|nr:anthranilate synthase component I family protein [Bacteroidales bacterium]
MRKRLTYLVENPEVVTDNMAKALLSWDVGIVLRGKDTMPVPGTDMVSQFDCAAGFGVAASCKPADNFFKNFEYFTDANNDWILGFLGYDLKNELENLQSGNFDGLAFPEMFFFVPEVFMSIADHNLCVYYYPGKTSDLTVSKLVDDLLRVELVANPQQPTITFKSRYSRYEYLTQVQRIKNHIGRGDIYEMNFCQEFYTEGVSIQPARVFNRLYSNSPTPFGAFLKIGEKFLMAASPERYLRKNGNVVVSQPIKGTAPRMALPDMDSQVVEKLKSDAKEISENVMIVDLVRNDLSRVAVPGSVKVNELCGIYTFRQVHQMISTVSCIVPEKLNLVEPIKATFPMGSMTGAPKVRAMQLIEEFEKSRRGIFSGAVGYITPNKNFDFNVVIRSLLYCGQRKYLSFSVGGAITAKSDPENEYNECLLKAKAILQTLNARIENVAG